MAELSIFIDESGEFGTNSRFYILSLVFHDQSSSIANALANLERHLTELGQPPNNAIHTGPIVRKEAEYQNTPLAIRRAVFARLFSFTRKAGVSFLSIAIDKRECRDRLELKARLARKLSLFLRDNLSFFNCFERILAYYDNGQAAITDLIVTVFSSAFFEVEFRRVKPSNYRLFQAADMICTLELARLKDERKMLTNSELIFFESPRKLRKNYLKQLDSMRFSVCGG